MTRPKTTSRQQRGITLFRERDPEIREVEPGVYRVPASEGGGFYRMDLDRQRCECADRAPVCKHLFAATIFAAKKRCRRGAATERPQRRHGRPREDQRDGQGGRTNNTPAPRDTLAPPRRDESLRGVLVNPERLAETAEKLGV